ncbi:mechanosensitive ion channel [Flavobacterium sp. F-380]|uniref:Mechanosensitive ion channel n=1 Tax=Flavobacterium kayseriense TaxID=2764714 RepID=A0ABR7JC06_9FLAO|nr:mechanosensitive ion channel domain-containing protein [Flavobacterium kayseriense]MBC5842752.1 mechanosensitive ion channel [Flavobacterium kayseriense]MBC5849282.1 mechanosensitive ion channel [Flavobacterium kayseriense]MBU0941134.1 mechanosensitive ion channel family protein [Bacteroidota bacterium]
MTFITDFTKELIASGILLVLLIAVRIITTKLVKRFAVATTRLEHRTNLVIKYLHLLANILALIAFIIIWGVQPKDIIIAISSITTVVGVAMFAQWSILSNITSGVILFFSFPFKIGDTIKIHDKDFPIVAEIEDIRAFHVSLITEEGEMIVYPNNLLFQKGISIIKQ